MRTRGRKLPAILLILCILCTAWIGAAAAEEEAAAPDPAPAEETAGAGEGEAETDPVEPGEGEPVQPGEPGEESGENPESGETPENGEIPENGEWNGSFPGGGGRPSGGFGGFGGGGGGRGGSSSGITPGKALLSSHAAGKGTMLRYGAVELKTEADSMQALILGGEELTLSCGGSAFTAELEEDVLILRSEEGNAWSLTMDVLQTLKISGVRQLRLIGPDTETTLDTDLELTGTLYGLERAQGFVSADYLLQRQGDEWIVLVDGREYRLNGNELC